MRLLCLGEEFNATGVSLGVLKAQPMLSMGYVLYGKGWSQTILPKLLHLLV